MQKPHSLGLFILSLALIAQGCATGASFTQNAPMNVDRPGWGQKRIFIQNNQVLNRSQAIQALKSTAASQSAVNSMTTYEAYSELSNFGGFFMFSWGLLTVLDKYVKDQPILIASGSVFLVLAAILDSSASKKAREAIDAYNQSISSAHTPSKPSLPEAPRSELKITPAGLAWVF
jgi:hypothetical protein